MRSRGRTEGGGCGVSRWDVNAASFAVLYCRGKGRGAEQASAVLCCPPPPLKATRLLSDRSLARRSFLASPPLSPSFFVSLSFVRSRRASAAIFPCVFCMARWIPCGDRLQRKGQSKGEKQQRRRHFRSPSPSGLFSYASLPCEQFRIHSASPAPIFLQSSSSADPLVLRMGCRLCLRRSFSPCGAFRRPRPLVPRTRTHRQMHTDVLIEHTSLCACRC